MGDCDGVEGPCPFAPIGCPHNEVSLEVIPSVMMARTDSLMCN